MHIEGYLTNATQYKTKSETECDLQGIQNLPLSLISKILTVSANLINSDLPLI